ncbi:MAG: ATP-dependent DNA helicase RecG [Microgenomates group bacterium GW2011_GWC1_37_8]|uniref:ATP-dependent DNA helicase RecG n=1 Tax=Candidatus Woesebacteria bacterium GW2011_GWB1_38_8 TaxID=1618570 RepID=A0A0G0LD82_9BACT|nr:MAG: ATP-dependent DNA helicase RecG [Microgenomates group bacterium GW2011_GWC1_37_8]KKQ85880.1 MAG: ATP-dependent DNA helicase RecG [Candidatus Woesebacteria bacterium GW2011_GWB1_38_8]
MDLKSSVSNLPMVGPLYAKRLDRLGISTVEDLLLHVPSRYLDYRLFSTIRKAQPGETITIKARIDSAKNIYTKNGKKIQLAEISDGSGTINAIWFNQPYLIRNIYKGELYSFSGKIDWFDRKKSFISPDYENIEKGSFTLHTGRLVPIYPETSRLSSKWLRSRIFYTYENLKENIDEFLPDNTLRNLSMINYPNSIKSVHYPIEETEAIKGKERLAFNELLFYQLKSLYRKTDWNKHKAVYPLKIEKNIINGFVDSLPFKLTNSQLRSIEEILQDMRKEIPMNRLLEGDVGSGKTVVAALASFVSFVNGYQTVVMAPTQILAEQHFNTLNQIFDNYKVRVSLVTSAGVKTDLGKTDIFIGTHALIHKKVSFDKVSLVVIDEQHRFGVEQRAHLAKKTEKGKKAPHILTMTATPIPRTIALTVYGDLDLSTLDELPAGRKPITTWLVPPTKREAAYNWISDQIKTQKIQVFIICPLIEESQIETMRQVKAATVEFEELKYVFPKLKLGLLHGRQNSKIKNEVLDSYKSGEIDILVSTPVVEVGIDVPNANIMVIEAAERFGLAQLHQLRGRIGRGDKKSYCLLFTESKSEKVLSRLEALRKTLSGFELAELDLKLRGPGEYFGTKQHGFPELKIASWNDTELIKSSRKVAQQAIKNPQKFSKLFEKIRSQDIIPN